MYCPMCDRVYHYNNLTVCPEQANHPVLVISPSNDEEAEASQQ